MCQICTFIEVFCKLDNGIGFATFSLYALFNLLLTYEEATELVALDALL